MSGIRLQKYMAEAGVASRRKCEELIAQGRVEVDGVVVSEPGTKVNGDEIIKVDGKEVKKEQKKVYILLNKPVGVISSAKDQFSRKTVLDLVEGIDERIYPVGRLDYDTSGLIILTNDGEFANMLMHPSHEQEKTYHAQIKGRLGEEDIRMLETGIEIEDYRTSPAKVRVLQTAPRDTTVEITIHEGRNRQVRKMFEALEHQVLRLRRTGIGSIGIGGLEEGKWRYLSRNEIETLKGGEGGPKAK
jgi:23S rRNA pseudouridine2605 synthase